MGNILDELRKDAEAHPEWAESRRAYDAKKEERAFLETFSGKVFSFLKEKGDREGVPVRHEEKVYGRTLFFYGDESAVLQTHIENGGLARSYTSMIDLQKPWWREAFLEYGEHGKLENVGLIAPSVMECLKKYFPAEITRKFQLDEILKSTSKEPANLGEEYVENDMYGTLDQVPARTLMDKIRDFWKPLAAPDFDVQFSNGEGDMYRKLRLIPLTRKGQDDLLAGGPESKQIMQKIIDRYDDLIVFLRAA
jgi:hypothetical protein